MAAVLHGADSARTAEPANKRMQQTGGAMCGRGAPPAADARCSADEGEPKMRIRRAVLLALALALGACDSRFSVDGTWQAQVGHFDFYVLQLRSDGDTITGLACSVSDGYLIFRDRPVSGLYPSMSFDATAPGGVSFRVSLTVLTRGVIIGTPGNGIQEEFSRTDSGDYTGCASAPPPPGWSSVSSPGAQQASAAAEQRDELDEARRASMRKA